ncbi:hypothetical protein [Bdellovibrio bacteriovorus]|nr:hypothetical protein [Bdellovibrio bacteriovorus]
MKLSTMNYLMTALVTTSLLSACGKGFESVSPSSLTGQNDNASQGTGTPPPKGPSEFDKLDMSSYVSGGNYDNEQVLALDKANNALLLFLPIPGAFTSFNLDVPEMKGVKITTVLDSQQKARVAVSIPLRLVVKDKVTTLPTASTLPGGRPLPMMPSGEYPSLGLAINAGGDNKVYLYVGVNAVGVFVESGFFPEYLGITAPIKNKAGTRTLGYFTIVPKQGQNKGGLFLSFLMPKDLATIIDNHLSGIIN